MLRSSIPRIVIAGTHSGCGKTTVATGVMAALRRRGLVVQPFKVGPDFIDPSHHSAVCGRESRNLDPFMMGEEQIRRTFAHASRGADVAVIEGVMGLFDGVDGSDASSTAHVARILDAAVVLVVDVKGMSRSTAAMIEGYANFDPSLRFAGVVLTKGGSERHRMMACSEVKLPILGWIPRTEGLSVSSRHLGLVMGFEDSPFLAAAELIEESCDLDAMMLAGQASPISVELVEDDAKPTYTVAVARDSAFCFYYADNFSRMRQAGAELVFFSPIADALPKADAYYFGGGYPELHAEALSCSPCRKDLKKAADAGTPIYGECGGLLWLSRSLEDAAGKTFSMAGLLDADSVMEKRFVALNYCIGRVLGNSFLRAGEVFGHEFHYSRCLPDRDAVFDVELSRGKGIENGKDGIVAGSVVAGYMHRYF